MKNKIEEFIRRRFPQDCNWTDGNRYKEIMQLSGLKSTVIHTGDVLTCPRK